MLRLGWVEGRFAHFTRETNSITPTDTRSTQEGASQRRAMGEDPLANRLLDAKIEIVSSSFSPCAGEAVRVLFVQVDEELTIRKCPRSHFPKLKRSASASGERPVAIMAIVYESLSGPISYSRPAMSASDAARAAGNPEGVAICVSAEFRAQSAGGVTPASGAFRTT